MNMSERFYETTWPTDAIEPDYEQLTDDESAGILDRTIKKISGSDIAGSINKINANATIASEHDFSDVTNTRHRGRTHSKRIRRIVLIAATVVVLGTIVSFAASYLGLDSPLMNFLNPANDEQVALVQKASTVIDKSVTHDGLTLHIKEAIGDRNCVYILYDITSEVVGENAGKGFSFDNISIGRKDNKSFRGGWGTYMLETYGDDGSHPGNDIESDSRTEDSDPNTSHWFLSIDSESGVHGKTMTMTIDDFGYYTEDGDFIPLIEGTWEISFKPDYEDSSQKIKVNKKVKVKDSSMNLKNIRISPISLTLRMSGSLVERLDGRGDMRLHDDIGGAAVPVLITMKDGAVIDLGEDSSGSSSNTDGLLNFSKIFEFSKVIEPDQIAAISVGDCVIGMK